MKKLALFATVLLALAMTASASDMIDFTQLAPSSTPQPIFFGYHNMSWTAIDYVSVPLYAYAGDGFKTGPEAQVALVGGPLCYQKHGGATTTDICRASITSALASKATFRPDYLVGSEGWSSDGSQFITVEAWLNGTKIGSQKFNLGVNAQKFKLVLPNAWGEVSQLVIYPSPGGSFVLYVMHVN